MAVITSPDEKVRRKAKSKVADLYGQLILSDYSTEDAAEWLGCSRENVYKIFHSGGIKAWQYETIKMHLGIKEV